MFEYLQTIIYTIIIPFILFTLLGGISSTKRYILKINRMNSILYRFKKTGKHKLLLLTLSLIIKTLYNQIIHSINNNIVKKSDKLYEIIYYIKGVKYVLCIDFDKKPEDDILQILDHDLNDCTDEIIPYFTPYFDYNKLTPKYFNKEKLIFTLSNDLEYTFKSNEIIDFSKKIESSTVLVENDLDLNNGKSNILSVTIPKLVPVDLDDSVYEEICNMGVNRILHSIGEIISLQELTTKQKDRIKYLLNMDNLTFIVDPTPILLEQQ